MQKKDDKALGKKTAYKKERQRKKESERKRSKYSQNNAKQTSPNFGFCACVKNKKSCLITSD